MKQGNGESWKKPRQTKKGGEILKGSRFSAGKAGERKTKNAKKSNETVVIVTSAKVKG